MPSGLKATGKAYPIPLREGLARSGPEGPSSGYRLLPKVLDLWSYGAPAFRAKGFLTPSGPSSGARTYSRRQRGSYFRGFRGPISVQVLPLP